MRKCVYHHTLINHSNRARTLWLIDTSTQTILKLCEFILEKKQETTRTMEIIKKKSEKQTSLNSKFRPVHVFYLPETWCKVQINLYVTLSSMEKKPKYIYMHILNTIFPCTEEYILIMVFERRTLFV